MLNVQQYFLQYVRAAGTAENIVAVRDSVAEETALLVVVPNNCIMHKDLHLHAYNVHLTQDLKPLHHSMNGGKK